MKMRKGLAASAVLLLLAGAALADVEIQFFEQGADVIGTAQGLLSGPLPTTEPIHCGGSPALIPNGAVSPAIGALCLGSGQGYGYRIVSGPSQFGTSLGGYADQSTGGLFGVNAAFSVAAADSLVVNSTSIWRNTTLAGLGIAPGPIGTWQLAGGDLITANAAPGPLGLLGVAAMWSWSRRLRRRIREGRR